MVAITQPGRNNRTVLTWCAVGTHLSTRLTEVVAPWHLIGHQCHSWNTGVAEHALRTGTARNGLK